MHPFLQKIEDLRRSGASALEIWPHILRVEKHRRIWEENYPQSQEQFCRWERILELVTLAQTAKEISIRKRAISQLVEFREEASAFVPVLIQLLQENHEEIRYVVVEILGQLEEDATEALPYLLQALLDPQISIRREATWAVGEIGQETPEIVSALINMLSDSDDYVRFNAVSALGEVGRKLPQTIVALIKTLKDSDFDVRRNAVSVLGKMGTPAKQAIPALLEMVNDWEWSVRCEIAKTLGLIQEEHPAIIPTLLTLFQDIDGHVRGASAEAFGRIGKKTPEILHALEKGLQDSSLQTRKCIAKTLGKLGGKEVLPLLFKLLSDAHTDVRYEAVIALEEFDLEETFLQEGLVPLLRDESKIVCFETARILGQWSLKFPFLSAHLENLEETRILYFLEGRVRKAIENSCLTEITLSELEKLGTANSPYFLETLAFAHAFKREPQKAYRYASKAYEDTLQQVETFLSEHLSENDDSETKQ